MSTEDIDRKVTQAMKDTAQRGLDLRKQWGRGAQEPGLATARAILNSEQLSFDKWKEMRAWFARHSVYNDSSKRESDGGPTAGRIAWLVWGGDAAQSRANAVMKSYEARLGSEEEGLKLEALLVRAHILPNKPVTQGSVTIDVPSEREAIAASLTEWVQATKGQIPLLKGHSDLATSPKLGRVVGISTDQRGIFADILVEDEQTKRDVEQERFTRTSAYLVFDSPSYDGKQWKAKLKEVSLLQNPEIYDQEPLRLLRLTEVSNGSTEGTHAIFQANEAPMKVDKKDLLKLATLKAGTEEERERARLMLEELEEPKKATPADEEAEAELAEEEPEAEELETAEAVLPVAEAPQETKTSMDYARLTEAQEALMGEIGSLRARLTSLEERYSMVKTEETKEAERVQAKLQVFEDTQGQTLRLTVDELVSIKLGAGDVAYKKARELAVVKPVEAKPKATTSVVLGRTEPVDAVEMVNTQIEQAKALAAQKGIRFMSALREVKSGQK